jgi:2-polyprenyl-6-methoxyphenol hydroxylase-like FAD-dependent oxidoreductase
MNQRILISGGGIAGMAAAWWLGRAGADVTIIERAQAFQPLGHYITLKSHGVRVVEAMGLLDACRARELPLHELTAHTANGRLLRDVDTALLTSKIEGMVLFRRADLHAALYEAVRDHTRVRFGTEVRAIRDVGDQVEVDLPEGAERVDLFLGADGVHSRARNLVFGEGGVSRMGGRYLAITVDYPHGLTPGALSTYFGRGQFVVLLPRTAANVSALIYHGDGGAEPSGNDALSVRAFLLRAYADFAPEVRRTFEALDESSFVFMDDIAMIELEAITRGRIALLGDAAHCPTFMSGMGASLALQGAYALSRALQQHQEVIRAVAAYECGISEVARGYQRSARKARPAFLNRSPQLALIRDALLQWTPDWLLARSARKFYQAAPLPTL